MGITENYIVPVVLNNPYVGISISVILLIFTIIWFQRSKQTESKNHGQKNQSKSESMESFGYDEEDLDDPNVVQPLHPTDTQQIQFNHIRYDEETMMERANSFYHLMNNRRSVRFFSDRNVPESIIKKIIHTAGTSPSGAHTEPWTFVAVKDKEIKEDIRAIVENEEKINYESRMGKQWVKDLTFAGTTWQKEYLTVAPWILLVFRQAHFPLSNGKRRIHYYNEISTSLAAGILLAAIQNVGLVSLTSTPMNCGPALRSVLNRPNHEKLMLLLPIGYPAEDATVPDLGRKPVDEIAVII